MMGKHLVQEMVVKAHWKKTRGKMSADVYKPSYTDIRPDESLLLLDSVHKTRKRIDTFSP